MIHESRTNHCSGHPWSAIVAGRSKIFDVWWPESKVILWFLDIGGTTYPHFVLEIRHFVEPIVYIWYHLIYCWWTPLSCWLNLVLIDSTFLIRSLNLKFLGKIFLSLCSAALGCLAAPLRCCSSRQDATNFVPWCRAMPNSPARRRDGVDTHSTSKSWMTMT